MWFFRLFDLFRSRSKHDGAVGAQTLGATEPEPQEEQREFIVRLTRSEHTKAVALAKRQNLTLSQLLRQTLDLNCQIEATFDRMESQRRTCGWLSKLIPPDGIILRRAPHR
jgi:hypothetical protein